MRAVIILTICVFCAINAIAQNNTTFEIEKLSKPKNVLSPTATSDIFKSLKIAILEKKSKMADSLVFFGENPFLGGAVAAYNEHRPFVISPDIIWLLISQGFARHISNNPEEFRKDIVNFEGQKELIIMTREIQVGNPKSNWELAFPEFSKQISAYTGKEFTDILTANFSTTTPTTKIVSQITIMEAVKAFFSFRIVYPICGIPKITIEGTTEDWEEVLRKTRYISKYKLEWWTAELEPILQQIINAKKGNFDKTFWMNMVKVHTSTKYGSRTVIDGWIVKFYPYSKQGKKRNLLPITKLDLDDLAPEMVKVPFIFEDEPNQKRYKMEFWGGFVGMSQNKKDFTLKPEIGWAINNVSSEADATPKLPPSGYVDFLSIKNVMAVPSDIYRLQYISFLDISFLGDIIIPDELAKIRIENLELTGRITEEEKIRIRKLFPKTNLTINELSK